MLVIVMLMSTVDAEIGAGRMGLTIHIHPAMTGANLNRMHMNYVVVLLQIPQAGGP